MASLYNINTEFIPLIWMTSCSFKDLTDDSDPNIEIEITRNFEVVDVEENSAFEISYNMANTAMRVRNYLLIFLNHDLKQFNTLLGELQRKTAINWNAYFSAPYQLCISHVLALESGLRKICKDYQASLVKRSPGSMNIARDLTPELLALELDVLQFPMDNEDGNINPYIQ